MSTPASSPQPVRPDPRFTISQFKVEGAKVVSAQHLEQGLKHLTGPDRRFSDIEEALQLLRDLYAAAGITAMQVTIPEQALDQGVVLLKVEEFQVKRVEITGAKTRSVANIRRAVPELQEGRTPVDTDLSESLRLANENPGRQMQVTFRTEDDGSLTGVLRVADRAPWSGQLSAENTGTATTGQWRVAAAAQHSNFLNKDIVGSAQIQTSPGYEKEVRIGSVSARIPLYEQGWLLDASAVYSSVDSGTVKAAGGEFLVSAVGRTASLRATRLLPRWGAADQRISLGLDRRTVDGSTRLAPEGENFTKPIHLRPVSVSYSLNWPDEKRNLSGLVSISRNLPGTGRSAPSSFIDQRRDANPRYTIVRAAGGLVIQVGDWSLSTNWNGQWTRDALVSAEYFGIGGEGSIRGFNGRVASSDKGQRLGLEMQSPMRALQLGSTEGVSWGWQTFIEAGEVHKNRSTSEEPVHTMLASLGTGLRLAWRGQATLRADAGVVARGDRAASRGEHFVHMSMAYSF